MKPGETRYELRINTSNVMLARTDNLARAQRMLKQFSKIYGANSVHIHTIERNAE